MTAAHVLILDGAAKRFGDKDVVLPTSLELGVNRGLGIVGPSGCGKSTLLKLVAGVETPTSGTIVRNFAAPAAAARSGVPKAHCVMMWQHLLLFPGLTARQNIELAASSRYIPRDERAFRLQRYSQLLELKAVLDRRVELLSGGERQRVALARTLIVEPAVVALDEPFSHLDPHLRHEARQLLCLLRRELGFSLMLVTHDRDDALYCCDEIGVMEAGGRIVQIAPYRQLLDRPASPTAAKFAGFSNVLAGTIVRIDSGASEADISTRWGIRRIRLGSNNPTCGSAVQIQALRSAFRVTAKARPNAVRMVLRQSFVDVERAVAVCSLDSVVIEASFEPPLQTTDETVFVEFNEKSAIAFSVSP
jgi:ABC-type Fe3+/spermidine/putrescine transport system ATPase subunit